MWEIEATMNLIAEPRYRDYVRRFKPKPGGPSKPLSKEDWEARVLGKPKDEKKEDKADKAKEAPKPAKHWAPKVKEVMEKHHLTDDDAEQVKAFKSDKPASGAKLSPQALMQRFMAKAKPETKERMKGMTPGEFMKMLAAIMDDEGGEMKMASRSMYASLVQLGVTNPELRPHIRPLLAKVAGYQDRFDIPSRYEGDDPRFDDLYVIDNGLFLKGRRKFELHGEEAEEFLGLAEKMLSNPSRYPDMDRAMANLVRQFERPVLAALGKRAGAGKIQVRDNGFKEIYPDPYNQTYDSYLIDHRNPKTVQALAMRALGQLQGKMGLSYSDVVDFVNNYVAENTKGRWTRVIWNSKSYPD